jgi:RimJ/RimL family protein N-acetyltransferase
METGSIEPMRRPATAELHTERLVLTPLRVTDASEMVGVLADTDLYSFTGANPPDLEEVESRYRAQVIGPARQDEAWHNWILRLVRARIAIGFVQATVINDSAEFAWVVGTNWQNQGFATEAAKAMREWLTAEGVGEFTAHIHPDHAVSRKVATAIGLRATAEVDSVGEVVWRSRSG